MVLAGSLRDRLREQTRHEAADIAHNRHCNRQPVVNKEQPMRHPNLFLFERVLRLIVTLPRVPLLACPALFFRRDSLCTAGQASSGTHSQNTFLNVLFTVLICTVAWTGGANAAERGTDLERSFLAPPDVSKPWAYWWWLNANVTKESITRDLEGMKARGLGGVLLFDVTAYGHHLVPAPERKVAFMSPEWRRLVHYAISEAGRLGLQVSVNLSTCGGALQAPWNMGAHAPKHLICTTMQVAGSAQVACRLAHPKKEFFWDVGVLAVRLEKTGNKAPTRAAKVDLWSDWSPVFEFSHRAARLVLPKDAPLAVEVVDLTSQVAADGRLAWKVPEGQWMLIRFGCETIEGHANDVDILNREAAASHFERIGRVILKDAGPLAGKTLTRFYNVSWEGASPGWTPGFEQEFRKYRGYDIRPYLPVLAGMIVESRKVSERFQADYCRTLSDCFLHNCYEQFTELCHQAGLRWHSESGGPWRPSPLFANADQLAFWGRNDMPQGEFWWPAGRSNARLAATAAHIYGKRLVSIEAFTHMRPHWSAWPGALKANADAAFSDGINQFVWHTSSASPIEFGKPGIVYFAGTHLNPNVTWWNQSGPFLSYLARCQLMLRQGHFVADVCCYTTDRHHTNWTKGYNWSEKPSLVPPAGYAYDLINTEVLSERLTVENGNLVLPDGIKYRLLVVDLVEEDVPPQALAALVKLAESGATIVLGTRRPVRAPGLADYPNCDKEVRRLADRLWGNDTGGTQTRTLGKGKVVSEQTMEQVLRARNIPPDCTGAARYIHRRVDGVDLYFVTGNGLLEATFRISGRVPELWDPKTGRITDALNYRTTDDDRTVVPLDLAENGSMFVVFRKPAQGAHLVAVSGPEGGLDVVGRNGQVANLRVWRNGRYVLTTSTKTQAPVDVPTLPEPKDVTGPWAVKFAPGWGAPESIVFQKLTPWNEYPQNAIKHFSGTATYCKTLSLDAKQTAGLVRLALGEVKHVAQVRVNGKDLGVLWTNPWRIDLTGVVKPGENTLEIDVTNVWANRLIGDAGLPENKRLTKTNIGLHRGKRPKDKKVCQGYWSTQPLLRSGLLGPVRLEFGREINVPLEQINP